MKRSLADAKVLITGGTGTFGTAFVDRCLNSWASEIRVFSRDEKKQYDMAQLYRSFPNVKFYVGDVRDKSTIDAAIKGVDYVFHAAAMKQVPTCECFPMEAAKTNIFGSENLLNSAIEHGVKKVVCLSTDKAVAPTSVMGITKAFMEKIALRKAEEQSNTEICVTRFGNLIASRGSAVPMFIEQIQKGLPITITDPNMTRFIMTVDDAVSLVEDAFTKECNGKILVKESHSCTTGDLAKAVREYLNLPEDYPVCIIGARQGEKMHEALLTDEEADRASAMGGVITVHKERDPYRIIKAEYKSEYAKQLNVEQLRVLISKLFDGGARR